MVFFFLNFVFKFVFCFRSWLNDCLSEICRKKDEYIQKWHVLEFLCFMVLSYIFFFFMRN